MASIKEQFLLDPSVHFLNHGSYGATPKSVFDDYQQWQRRLETQPVLFLSREIDARLLASRVALGGFLNSDAENLVYIPNATHGVNIVARSVELQPGDEILTSDHEYGACDFTWGYLCERIGAKYIHQHIPFPVKSKEEVAEEFWRGVTPRTKIIYLSQITSPTALRLPVEIICAKARQAGILTVIDAAHAPGQIPLDLRALDADIVFGNCHKWMLAPKGAAFLYVRRDIQAQIEPFVVSWGYHPLPDTSTGSRFIDILQWTGTKDFSAPLAVPAAIRFMEENHWTDVRRDCHALLRRAVEEVGEATGLHPMYPLDSDFYSQMAVAPLPQINARLLQRLLYDECKVEVPITDWNGNFFVRISIQAYNTHEDVDALVNGLRSILPRVAI